MSLKDRIEAIAKASKGGRKYTYEELAAIRDQENKEFSADIAEKRRKAILEKTIGRSGIQPLHQSCTVSNFETDSQDKVDAKRFAFDYIKNFAENKGKGFIFSGTPGTGKNHLAAAICNALIKSGKSCMIITVNELMQKLRNTYQKDSQTTEDQFIQSMIKHDLLVLDEIGLQRGTDAERLVINQIVDQRVCQIKPTGMLTNLSAEELEAVVGARIMDRMRMNGGKWIPFNWESHRK